MDKTTEKILENKIQDLFANKAFSIKNTGLTYRVINNWSEKGLINHFRASEKEWHRFSFMQLIEIGIYNELRAVGFSLDKLIKIKKYINKKMKSGGQQVFIAEIKQPMTPLVNAMVDVLYTNGNIFLVSDADCQDISFISEMILAEIITGNSPLINEVYGNRAGIFFISLRELLKKLKIKSDQGNSKLALLISAILDDECSYGSELLVNLLEQPNPNLKISKLKKREYKNIKEIKDLTKLVNKSNQTTTIHSDGFGAHKVVIEKEIK